MTSILHHNYRSILKTGLITTGLILSYQAHAVMNAGSYLSIQQGPSGFARPVDGNGSYFAMEALGPGGWVYTGLGGKRGLHLNNIQFSRSANSPPELSEVTSIDKSWVFFGNSGVHQTTIAPTILADDGVGNASISLAGWNVSWNNVPSIALGDRSHDATSVLQPLTPESTGVIKCAVDCDYGDTYILNYTATVPASSANFPNVKYFLHLEGTITATLPAYGNLNVAAFDVSTPVSANSTFGNGTVSPGTLSTSLGLPDANGITAEQVRNDPQLNPEDGTQCLGGCVDFKITGFSGDYATIVFHLDAPITDGAKYRKLINGRWDDFSEEGANQVGSQADSGGLCQSPDGTFDIGLNSGNQCVFLRIVDGGPNDADGIKNGVIIDPSGVLVAGSGNAPAGTTDGCSMTGNTISIAERADWFLIAGFIAWLGLIVRRKRTL